MDKRYQVFISSTYEDLTMERQEVMHALLELDCIPAGMELFPAANEDQWSLIRKVIDESDYYLVISAGRYGSIGPHGQSYTEMEYRYAIDSKTPVIAFLHRDPSQLIASKCEQTDEGRAKLQEFRGLLRRRICKDWSTADELGSVVSRSLIRLIKNTPAVGWVRADRAVEASAGETLKYRKRIEELEAKLMEVAGSAPAGSEGLAQGDDLVEIHFSFVTGPYLGEKRHYYQIFLTWNQIFHDVGPAMIDEASERQFITAFNNCVEMRSREPRRLEPNFKDMGNGREFEASADDFQTVKVQLRALGLMTKSNRNHGVRVSGAYWTLTPYGDGVLTTLRAVQKQGLAGTGGAAPDGSA
jgi:hypothetical protein